MKTTRTLFILVGIFLYANLVMAQSAIFVSAKKNFNEGKFEESNKLFNTIGKNSVEYGEARYYLGRICCGNGKFDDAIKLFKEAIVTNNKNAEYYFWLGNAYSLKTYQSNILEQGYLAREIIKNLEIGAKLDSTHQEIRWGLMNFYSIAPSIVGGDMSKAYKAADELNKLKYPDGFEAKGYVYERDNKKELAEKSFKEAIKASPNIVKYYYALAYFYLRQNKNENSIELFEKIIDINPQEANAHFEIGKFYSTNDKKLDQGKQYLLKYLQLANPNYKNDISRANYYLGNIYNTEGDKTNAKKYYNMALSLDPSFKDAKKALEKL